MMNVRLTLRATRDLAEIADYFREHKPRSAFAPLFSNRSRAWPRSPVLAGVKMSKAYGSS
jgi:plasmid stabilization system protein ParE